MIRAAGERLPMPVRKTAAVLVSLLQLARDELTLDGRQPGLTHVSTSSGTAKCRFSHRNVSKVAPGPAPPQDRVREEAAMELALNQRIGVPLRTRIRLVEVDAM